MKNYRQLHRSARLVRIILVSAVAVGFAASRLYPVAAQSEGVTYQNPLAYIGADGRYYVTSLDGTSATAVTSEAEAMLPEGFILENASGNMTNDHEEYVSTPRWSPDGSEFAYLIGNSVFYTVESGRKNEVQVATVIPDTNDPLIQNSAFAWSPDGNQLAYIPGGFSKPVTVIKVISLDKEYTQDIALKNPPRGGGAGDGPLPEQAWVTLGEERDEDFFTHDALRFNWINQGFLFGPYWGGTSIIEDTGTTVWDAQQIYDINVSPDGSRAFGTIITYDASPQGSTTYPKMIDLATGTEFSLPLTVGDEPLAWTSDGQSIIFGTVTLYKQIKAVDKVNPEPEHDDYILTLWRQGLDEKQPTKLFQHEGYDFGRVTVAPDDSAVVFSLISNTVFDKVDPEVQIVAVPMNGGPADWIAIGGKPAFGSNPFTAIPADTTLNVLPEVNCPKSLISRLKIGQRGQVTPGAPNSLRTLPSGGTQLRDLLAGDKFLVLEGPTCGAGGLAWWRVNYRGVVGWTAESDSKSYWLEP